MTDQHNLNAVAELIRTDPCALHPFSDDDAFYVLNKLHNEGLEAAELIELIRHSKHPNAHLAMFFSKIVLSSESDESRRNKIEFGVALWQFRNTEELRLRVHSRTIRGIFEDPDIYAKLLDTEPLAELSVILSNAPNDYWLRKIRRSIANKDHDRAWEEIFKAYKCKDGYPNLPTIVMLALELAESVGLRMIDKSRQRKINPHSKLADLLKGVHDPAVRGIFQSLHNYFGARKARKSKQRRDRKLEEYESKIKPAV